jgi:hypothetical protein
MIKIISPFLSLAILIFHFATFNLVDYKTKLLSHIVYSFLIFNFIDFYLIDFFGNQIFYTFIVCNKLIFSIHTNHYNINQYI